MNLLSYSQNTSTQNSSSYPKKVIIDSDTLVLITIPQIRQANLVFINADFYKELSDTLRVLTSKQQRAILAEHNLIVNYENQLQLKKQIISSYDEVTSSYKKMESKHERQIQWLRFQRNTIAVVCGVTLIKIFLPK